MTRMIIVVSASLAAALAAGGCGGGSSDKTLTVPPSANSKTPLPQVTRDTKLNRLIYITGTS
jgi:hypothetical protein